MKYFLNIFICLLIGIFSLAQAPSSNYELVWQDEFNGTQLDLEKWKYRSLGPRRDAINTPRCVTIQKGYLALRTESKNNTYYTAMISSENRFETIYGYFEVKCKLQTQQGHWSAFWLQTPIMGDFIGNPAKAGAEIDIFEFLPNKPKQIHHTLHYDGYENHHKVKHKIYKNRKFDSRQWHTFGLEWTPEGYTYYIDGEKTYQVNEGISKRDQYLILSLEVGSWAGDISKAKLPDYFIVDYVRVYKQKSH